jgi:hypothetical protein
MQLIRLISVILVTVICSLATDLANTFQQAVDLAEAQDKLPGIKKYSGQTLMPFWQQQMGPIFQACFKSVKQADSTSFAFVAALGPDGKVVRVYTDHETNMYQCMLVTLKSEQFPAPPTSPYYLHISMQFADPAPSNAWPDGGPPLVVERNKYSYTFGVPEGWEFNFEKAHQRGASLAYFPKGSSFNDSSSVVYVNLIGDDCSGSCSSLLAESIAQTLHSLKADTPGVEINVAEPVVTKDGVKASVRLLKGAKDPRDSKFTDNQALAFIAHDQAIILVVLASRDPKTWNQDYSALRQIVAGHRLFTCKSPGLAVPCGK